MPRVTCCQVREEQKRVRPNDEPLTYEACRAPLAA